HVSPANRTLQHGPETLDGIRVVNSRDVSLLRMVTRPVREADVIQPMVGAPFISADRAALFDVAHDMRLKRAFASVRNNARHDIATAFKHSEHDRFVSSATSALTMRATTNISF